MEGRWRRQEVRQGLCVCGALGASWPTVGRSGCWALCCSPRCPGTEGESLVICPLVWIIHHLPQCERPQARPQAFMLDPNAKHMGASKNGVQVPLRAQLLQNKAQNQGAMVGRIMNLQKCLYCTNRGSLRVCILGYFCSILGVTDGEFRISPISLFSKDWKEQFFLLLYLRKQW